MKVVPIKNIKPRDDLITLIYEQDEVKKILLLNL